MAKKRKRARASTHEVEEPRKSLKTEAPKAKRDNVKHPTLCLYYRQILTLRDYLLKRLPTTSKTRRRRIAAATDPIFDKTLVCVRDTEESIPDWFRPKDFDAYSQQVNLTAGRSFSDGSPQSDLIDFAIWYLFYRRHRHEHKPPQIICHGYQRANNPGQLGHEHCAMAGIPGLLSNYPNANVDTLKSVAWAEILSLLGKEGNRIMLDMVFNTGLFVAIEGGQGNYYQLSGKQGSRSP